MDKEGNNPDKCIHTEVPVDLYCGNDTCSKCDCQSTCRIYQTLLEVRRANERISEQLDLQVHLIGTLKIELEVITRERDAWKARATELEATRIGDGLQEANKKLDDRCMEKAAIQMWDYPGYRSGYSDEGMGVNLRLEDKTTHIARWVETIKSSLADQEQEKHAPTNGSRPRVVEHPAELTQGDGEHTRACRIPYSESEDE